MSEDLDQCISNQPTRRTLPNTYLDVARLVIIFKPVLRMTRAQRQSLRNLLINNNIDLYTSLRRCRKQPIQSILLILRRWSSQIQFGRKPPIENPNLTLGVLERNTDGVHVTASVNVPLDIVAFTLRSKGLESMEMVAVVIGTVLDEVHV